MAFSKIASDLVLHHKVEVHEKMRYKKKEIKIKLEVIFSGCLLMNKNTNIKTRAIAMSLGVKVKSRMNEEKITLERKTPIKKRMNGRDVAVI